MGRRTGCALALMICLLPAGCRLPKPYFARSAAAQTPLPVSDERVLQRPVALVDWHPEESSTWQILYATNRGRAADDPARGAQYGNQVLPTAQYGVCEVELARGRPQGVKQDAAKSAWPAWLPLGQPKNAPDGAEANGPAAALNAAHPLDEDGFFEELRRLVERSPQGDVLLFVHGFNVDYDNAVLRATQVAADLPFNGAVVIYSWPSQGGVKNYRRDGEVVDESVPAFTRFLTELGRRMPPEAKINIVVHSMGNRLVQRSLWHLPDEFAAPPRFAEIVFCAPDVGVDEFRRNIRQAKKVAGRLTLYQCYNDAALIASKFRNWEERAGSPLAAVLVEGMDTIETASIDTSLLGHSYYGSNPSVLRDLFAVVKEHRPVEERSWLKRQKIPFAETPLWIFNGFPPAIARNSKAE